MDFTFLKVNIRFDNEKVKNVRKSAEPTNPMVSHSGRRSADSSQTWWVSSLEKYIAAA